MKLPTDTILSLPLRGLRGYFLTTPSTGLNFVLIGPVRDRLVEPLGRFESDFIPLPQPLGLLVFFFVNERMEDALEYAPKYEKKKKPRLLLNE